MSLLGALHRAPKPAHEKPAADADLTVVRSRKGWLRAWVAILTLLAVSVLFGLVAFQALIVDNQSRIDDLGAELKGAERANARLRLEVAELEAPDRIRSMAMAFGMVEPETIIYLEPISAAELAPAENESTQ